MKLSPDLVQKFRNDVHEFVHRAMRQPQGSGITLETDFLTALEELQVAEEELRTQNDELVTTRLALETERHQYAELFELAPDAYIVTDPRGVIRQANVAASRLLRVPQAFVTGKPITLYLEEISRRRVRHFLEEATPGWRTGEWFLVLHPRRGHPVHVAATISEIGGGDGTVQGYRWLIRDLAAVPPVTAAPQGFTADDERQLAWADAEVRRLTTQLEVERSAREAAEASSRARSEFLATLSHELRTPLQALVGYTEILASGVHGDVNEAQSTDLERMQRSQQVVLRIINTVLDFLRLESGARSELELRQFSLPEVLRGIHTLIAPQLESKNLAFVSNYEDPPPKVFADPSHVQQIVLNLLANAVKFTPPRGTISVTTESEETTIATRISDTGVGISSEMLEAIFEPFVRGRRHTSSGDTGTGLGLAISRRLAEAMSGSLTAESSEGAGSTFTLRLPKADG